MGFFLKAREQDERFGFAKKQVRDVYLCPSAKPINYTMRFLFILLLFAVNGNHKNYPQDAFISPVNHKILLSGTFGELRSNHFHSGIDIKSSNGGVGDPILAIADGYVSRIKIAGGGYGNALYLRHPNGYTSVYCHLHDLAPELADYVKRQQYARKSFSVDLYPPEGQFTVTQGQEIGHMGTSGYSFGPHLHFEIRSSASERPINPLLFGFEMQDTRAPRMHKLKLYTLNDRHETTDERTVDLHNLGGNRYGVAGDTLTLAAWRAGLALKVFDHHNGVSNWNGVYKLDVTVDGRPTYGFEMEDFSFAQTRYLNAHVDYCEQKTDKSLYHRTYRLPGNELDIYTTVVGDGIMELSNRRAARVEMRAGDVDGNVATLTFWLKRGEVTAPASAPYNYVLLQDQANEIDNGALRLTARTGTFYENVYLAYQSLRDGSDGYHSNVHHLGDPLVPVHRYFDLSIRPTGTVPAALRDKVYLAECRDGDFSSHGGKWDGAWFTAPVRSFGDFALRVDTLPPTITPVSFSRDRSRSSKMSFKISDNLPTSSKARGLRYRGTVDGQWVLFEFDAKKDLLTHRFDERLPRGSGEHELRLEVTDDRGNVATYERTFVR